MIELKNVTKKYGLNTAVDNISAKFEDGEIIGFLGPNGAGKSTTMNMMTGYISTTSGSIEIDGYDILKDAEKAKSIIGYLPENPPLYMDMTVFEYLKFVYDLKGVKVEKSTQNIREYQEKYIDEIMSKVKITTVKHRKIKNLSKGYKQRVGIAQALVGNPKVLILDEPTVGLDPNQILDMRNLIRELGKSKTVIISSHILSEITSVCTKVLIINNGKLVVFDTIKNINRQLVNQSVYVIKISGDKEFVSKEFNTLDDVQDVVANKTDERNVWEYTITPVDGVNLRTKLIELIYTKKLELISFESKKLSLEDIFRKVTESRKKTTTKNKGDN